ncbi:TPA: radical SAM protein [Escherichia coli]|nr:radical SAM protein [Escherichia coli]
MTLKQIQTLIYRGEIKSCNYRCGYCPFHKQDRNDKQQDEAALWRMVEHLPALGSPLNVLITPYGEALRYRYYMAAMAKISRYSHVQAVGIQTNASFNLSSLIATMQDNQGDLAKLRLWCSFHPSQVSKDVFLKQILAIKDAGITCSVGAVASVNNYDTFQWLRAHLPADIYFWLNANERDKRPTSDERNSQFQMLDPLYHLETSLWPANVEFCIGGKKSVFMNADGDLFACNISKIKIGNLYQQQLSSPACMARQCHCYLAYHLRQDIPALSQFDAERCFRIFSL